MRVALITRLTRHKEAKNKTVPRFHPARDLTACLGGGAIQTSLADPYRMHSKLFDWQLQRRFRDHAFEIARTMGAETMLSVHPAFTHVNIEGHTK